MFLTVGEAIVLMAVGGAAFGFCLAWAILTLRCDRHSAAEYDRGLAEGRRRAIRDYHATVPGLQLAPFDLPAELERICAPPPPGDEDSRETTLIRALMTAPLDVIASGAVQAGHRPAAPPRDQTWLRASVRQLINRAARRPA